MRSSPGPALDLFVKVTGASSEQIVLLHGSLTDHTSWDATAQILARQARVIVYDRRGHSQSASPGRQDTIVDDARDLAMVIERVASRPAHVVATSGGAAIALRLAAQRPDLFLSLLAHEPPLLGALPDLPEWRPVRSKISAVFAEVVKRVCDGDISGAVRFFVDALDGPASWDNLNAEQQATFLENAWTLYYECLDEDFFEPDWAGLTRFKQPLLLSQGEMTAPFFSKIIDVLIEKALPHARRHIYANAGHDQHETHPQECADTVLSFIRSLR